jgi:hypothetical protein
MNIASSSLCVLRLGLGLAVCAAAVSSEAQTSHRSVTAVPQRQAPVFAAGQVGPGAPRPAGLPSTIPNPAGLTSQFPAGLPSRSPDPGLPAPTDPTLTPPVTTIGGRPVGTEITPPQTTVLGASGYGAPAGPIPSGAGGGLYTALQVARSFLIADANRDGELTRAEAQRLTLMPYTFEEMDRNHDGIITRFEYEDAMH